MNLVTEEWVGSRLGEFRGQGVDWEESLRDSRLVPLPQPFPFPFTTLL